MVGPPHHMLWIGAFWGMPEGQVASISAAGIKVRWLDDDGDRVADREELYDLGVDPLEPLDLAASPAYALDLAKHRTFLAATIPPERRAVAGPRQ